MDAPAVADDVDLASVLNGLRRDRGLQELVPFLSRYVASGLMSRRNLRDPDKCRRLVRVFDAMLDNPSLHLDLHLHQMFVPVGTCVVARNLSSSSKKKEKGKGRTMFRNGDHWSLREEAARALVKACDAYGDQYATARPRLAWRDCDGDRGAPVNSLSEQIDVTLFNDVIAIEFPISSPASYAGGVNIFYLKAPAHELR
ncbi:hypothetical protein ACHAW5_007851 [Stephanodiscus triporus]|uniref:TAF6 C-terminal HEAT repeat domain-containing protein n=1 Tax=Stephanodiscus triporus TaxID=2934178 RepID=A0ABD3Q737_9STRA